MSVIFNSHFSVTESGNTVTLEGKIFEVGTFSDKGFALTEAEADAAIQAFTPVPLEIEHWHTEGKRSIFDGKLGTLDSLERRGRDLWGRVRIPAFVDWAWGLEGRKISAVWDDQEGKRLIKAGLVLQPRIADAQLQHAFAAFSSLTHEEQPMNEKPNIGAELVNWLREKGLLPAAETPVTPAPAPTPAQFTAPPTGAVGAFPGGATISVAPIQQAPIPAQQAGAGAQSVTPEDPRIARLEEQVRLLTQMNTNTAQTARHQFAESRINALVHEDRVTSAEAPELIADLEQRLADDAASPLVITFSDQTKGGRADRLVRSLQARPPRRLLDNGATILFSVPAGNAADDPTTPEGGAAEAKAWAERMNGTGKGA